jgi:hypothetical protein
MNNLRGRTIERENLIDHTLNRIISLILIGNLKCVFCIFCSILLLIDSEMVVWVNKSLLGVNCMKKRTIVDELIIIILN